MPVGRLAVIDSWAAPLSRKKIGPSAHTGPAAHLVAFSKEMAPGRGAAPRMDPRSLIPPLPQTAGHRSYGQSLCLGALLGARAIEKN